MPYFKQYGLVSRFLVMKLAFCSYIFMLINIKTKTMLEKMQQYQIENESCVYGGKTIPHNPECFSNQTD